MGPGCPLAYLKDFLKKQKKKKKKKKDLLHGATLTKFFAASSSIDFLNVIRNNAFLRDEFGAFSFELYTQQDG